MRVFPTAIFLGALAVSATGCTSDGAPVVPFSMVGISPLVQSVTVGLTVNSPPQVRLLDASQNPAAGVTVTWTLVAGGGSIGNTSSTTNANGVATLTSWTVGTTSGVNRVSASASTLPDVSFEAHGVAAAPATAVVHAGNAQQALTGQVLPIDPAIRILDQYGNPVPNVPVQFNVIAGEGVITGADQETDLDGVAMVESWRLGAVPGENRLRASPQTLLPVTFMAQANLSPKCSSSLPYVLGDVVVAALTDDDCLLANEFYHDFYSTTIVGTQAVRFTMQSNVLNPYLLVADADGNILAEDDNGAGQGSFNSALTLIAGAGTLLLAPSSAFTYELGSYTFSSTLVSGNATGCQTIYVTPGIVSEQTLTASDCLLEGDPFFADQFVMVLTAGVPVTIRMTSTELDTWVGLYAPGSPNAVAFNDDISASNFNSELTYTPTVTNYYLILTSSHLPEETGAYTFEILPQAPGAAVRAPGSSLLRGGKPRLKSAFTPRLLVRRK